MTERTYLGNITNIKAETYFAFSLALANNLTYNAMTTAQQMASCPLTLNRQGN